MYLWTGLGLAVWMAISLINPVRGELYQEPSVVTEDVQENQQSTALFQAVPDGNVNELFVNAVNDQIAQLSETFQQEMLDADLTIYVTDKDIDETFCDGAYGSVQGITLRSTDGRTTIYIEDRQKAVENAPIHEIGHWYDDYGGFLSYQDTFEQIYEQESDAFCQTFVVDFYYDKGEFFAEGFWKYWTEPDRLKASCPALFAYLDSYLSEYTS